MTQSIFRGPVVNAGSLTNATTQGQVVDPFDGPTINYQSQVIPDVRYAPLAKDATQPGVVPAFLGSPFLVTYDGIPQATSTTIVAAAQQATASIAMALNTVGTLLPITDGGQFLTYGVPIIPQGTTQVAIVQAIDFGFTSGTTVASSSSVVVPDSRSFATGQWLCIGGVGNSSSNTALITQVTGVTNRTTITISPVAATGRPNAPIGAAGLFSNLAPPASQFVSAVTPSSATNAIPAGLAAVFDPRWGAGRNLSVSASTTNNGTSGVLVTGYDVHGALMTELMTCNGTTKFGLKAFKYVSSVVPTADGTGIAIGIGDTLGFAWRLNSLGLGYIRSDNATASIATSVRGFTAAIVGPSTNTSGDVRGTVQLNTGTLATSQFGVSINGVNRITLAQWATPAEIIGANPLSYSSLFGVAQA